MKRILAALMTCAILLSALVVTSFAFSKEIGNVDVPKLECGDVITVDGKIDTKNEIWGQIDPINVNESNTTTAWNYRARIITNTDIRFAYSNEGLYIAAFTIDDTPIRSTGHDMHEITGEDENIDSHAWNGDTIILAFDPLQCMTYSYSEWDNYSQESPAWYCFTLMEDGTTGAWRTRTMEINEDGTDYVYNENGDISDVVTASASSFVSGKWNLEVFIPWEELAYTLGLVTEGNYVFDAEEFAKSGVVHSAKFIYMNRYAYNQNDGTDYSGMFLGYPDTGTVVTICRNYTVSDKIPGTSYNGTDGNPEQVRTSGIYLNLVDNTNDDELHTPASEPEIVASTCTKQGTSTIYCTSCREILSREYLDIVPHDYQPVDAAGKQKCSVCDATAGAVVNGTDGYATFSAAYEDAKAGDSIKIFASETFASTLALDKAVTIDLGGKTIKSENGPVFEISADVEFVNSTGTGKVTGNGVDPAVTIKSGKTTVNAGRFSGEGVAIFDVAEGAQLVINKGQIRSIADAHFTGNGSIVVNGGVFRGVDPTAYLAPCLGVSVYVDDVDGYTEYTVIAEHIAGEVEEKAPTCTEDGYRKATCTACGGVAIDEVIPALGHTEGQVEEKAPTCTEDGYRKANCTVCGEVAVDEIIPASGHTEGEEQIVEVSCTVDGAKYSICTVCGEVAYYEVTEAAPGHSYKLVVSAPSCTESGINSFVCHCGDTHEYEIPAAGHAWGDWTETENGKVRTCGSCGETETITGAATVESEDLVIKLSKLAGAKDFLIAKGTYDSYRELKPFYIYRATSAKFAETGSFDYAVSEGGDYTVIVRYADGSDDLVIHLTIDTVAPVITTEEKKVTVDNLDDIYVIRCAPGVWETSGQVKRAEGCRNFTWKTINGADSFAFTCAEAGTYTVVVQYYNGLIVVETITIE